MVRKGSPVRVRQRASSDSPATAGFSVSRETSPLRPDLPFGAFLGHARAPKAGLPCPLPRSPGGWLRRSRDVELDPLIVMPALRPTPFDDLDPAHVMRVKDVAARLHVDARSVRRAIVRGDLVASRACGLRILAADAADWWRRKTVGAEPASDTEEPIAREIPRRSPARRTRRQGRRRLPLPPRGSES